MYVSKYSLSSGSDCTDNNFCENIHSRLHFIAECPMYCMNL
jgi:hypothetical protein